MAASKKEKPIIEVKHLSKQYNVNTDKTYKMLSENLTSAMKHPLKTLKGFSKPNDIFWALKDVNFEVERGEVVGIIGRNGAGKSTFLKILSRITYPTEGEVYLRGRVGSLLEVGTGFHPELTGRENIYFNGAILGMKKREIENKFDEIVKFSGVEKFLDTPIKRYSSGMNVRLAFSVAAHLDPEILIVDEVLAVGDAEFQKKCLGKMRDVAKEGRTVLFVSHNMNAVEQLCKSCILLENGKITKQDSDVRSVISSYLFKPNSDGITTEWINQENEYNYPEFKPLNFSIIDKNGNCVKNPISNIDEIFIKIEGIIQKIDPSLTIGYAIYNEEGVLLYWSYQTDISEDKWSPLKVGINRLISQIPKNLLNEGSYRIELIGGLHFRKWFFEPRKSAPGVNFEIRGGLSDSPYWMIKRPGILAPIIKWEVS